MARHSKIKARCNVCAHPERHPIELLRLGGTPTDTICLKYPELKRDSICRHMASHVSDETKASIVADIPLAELAERAAAEGGSLLDYFQIIRATVMSTMQRAAAVNDYTGTAALAKRATELNQAIGRLTGELLNSSRIRNFTPDMTNQTRQNVPWGAICSGLAFERQVLPSGLGETTERRDLFRRHGTPPQG